MNCMQFQKYVGAYADGELGVEKNLEALDHLKMCPSCVKRVTSIQNLKAALKRAIPVDEAPASLLGRIQQSLSEPGLTFDDAANDNVTALSGDSPDVPATGANVSRPSEGRSAYAGAPREQSRPGRLRFPVNVALGLAAVLVLAVGIRDFWFGPSGSGNSAMAATMVFNEATRRHQSCSSIGKDPSQWPGDPETAACCLRRRVRLRVVAPDLSSYGYQFIGADTCGLADHRGAHLVYRHVDRPSRLSLFFVERFPDVKGDEAESAFLGDQACLFKKGPASTVLWQESDQSCVACACGGVEKEILTQIAQVVRNADRDVSTKTDCSCPEE